MHILLIHQAFASIDEPGGTRHHELARFLVDQGHRVTVIASPISYLTGRAEKEEIRARRAARSRSDDPQGLEILRTYTYPAWHRSFVHRIFSFLSFMLSSFWGGLQVRQVDLVWGTSPPIFQGLTAWALARLKGARFLFEVRDLWPAFAVGVGVLRHPVLIRASEWLERFLYRHADRVVVNSPGFIQHVRERGARQVELVPNGADVHMFDPAARGVNFRLAHDLGDRFVVLYAGAHGMSNDLGVVLQAAELLHERTDIAIVLLGDGKEKPALMRQAESLGLKNVFFIPPVPKADMPQALAAADACLAILKPIPLYGTVYPNKIFDYMAAGRPVLLAIGGVAREVVERAGAGVYVPPGDPASLAEAIRDLADRPATRAEMGFNGRRYVEANFDRKKLALDLEYIMSTLVNKGNPHLK